MKSPLVENASYIKKEDKGNYTELRVLQSAAGFYIGTMYNNPEGFQEPGSRESRYFRTRTEAEAELEAMKNEAND